MNVFYLVAILSTVSGSIAFCRYWQGTKIANDAADRLLWLAQRHWESNQQLQSAEIVNWQHSGGLFDCFRDRLGRAGFVTSAERRQASKIRSGFLLGLALIGAVVGWSFGSAAALFGAIVGLYLGLMIWLFYLAWRRRDLEREILFRLPLTLEAMILLVESGLGILPAIERIVNDEQSEKNQEQNKQKVESLSNGNPVVRVFRAVYRLAAHGMPISQALELATDAIDNGPLRHVLLHLDISASEGGELVPALRSLSDHAHLEWKLSVESRVKHLENSVVFPVFASVMGLLLLSAAVPLVPVLDFMSTLDSRSSKAAGPLTGSSAELAPSLPVGGLANSDPELKRGR